MGAPSADQPTFANPARPAKGPRAPARSWMLIIFVAALLVRVLHVLADSRSPFFDFRGIDALDYHLMAQGLLNGTWPGDQPFFWAPFYPMFLGGLYALVGQSCLVLKLVQAVIGALTCVLVYRVGMRVFRASGVASDRRGIHRYQRHADLLRRATAFGFAGRVFATAGGGIAARRARSDRGWRSGGRRES
jgi:hypothetical protein